MKQRSTGRLAAHLLLTTYLFFFLGWVVPHHTCDHTPKDLHSYAELTGLTGQHSIHNPDLCQLCKTHGQIDLIADAVLLSGPLPQVTPLDTASRQLACSVHYSSPDSRAPPTLV